MTGTEQQILEKVLQKERRFPDSFFEIGVIGSDQSIAEIAAVVLEQLIGNRETERPQIFDGKDRRGAGIALGKRMNLPQPGDKKGSPCGLPFCTVNAVRCGRPFNAAALTAVRCSRLC